MIIKNTDGINKEKKKVTTILGDSMIKDIKGWKLNKSLKEDFIVVKSFPGATIECMTHYVKPSINQKPDRFVIHIGTNDLKTDKTPSKIVKEIFNLSKSVHMDTKAPVIISGIVPRGDNLKGKAEAVNELLKRKCVETNVAFIDHENIDIYKLNGSKLHLNKSGTNTMAKNFLQLLQKLET